MDINTCKEREREKIETARTKNFITDKKKRREKEVVGEPSTNHYSSARIIKIREKRIK